MLNVFIQFCGGRCGSSSGIGWKRSTSLTCFPQDVVPQWDPEEGGTPRGRWEELRRETKLGEDARH